MQKVEIYLLVLGAVGTKKKKSLSNVLTGERERYQVDMQSYPSAIHIQVTNKNKKTMVDHVAQTRKRLNHIWPCHVLLTKDK